MSHPRSLNRKMKYPGVRRRKQALSSVYGFIVVYTLIVVGLGAFSAVMYANANLESSDQRAGQIDSMRHLEHLTLTLTPGSVIVLNDGLVTSQLAYLHLVYPSTSADSRIATTLSVNSTLSLSVSPSVARVAVVTDLGDVFWAGGAAGGPFIVTFDAAGLSASLSNGTLATVDGTSYSLSQLPKTFSWGGRTLHSYSFTVGFPTGVGSRVGWSDTRGLVSARAGRLVVSQAGLIVADYQPQYLLSIVAGSGISTIPNSPAADGYFNAGTTVKVQTNYAQDTVLNQSRQSLVSYQLDDSTAISVPRTGGGVFSTVLTMNSPHTITFNSVPQYRLHLPAIVPCTRSPPPLPAAYLYYQSFSVSQALGNPTFESGSASPWLWNSGSCGSGAITFGVETGLQRSGSFNGYASSSNGKGCVYQVFSLPPASVVTSATASAWVLAPNTYPAGAITYVEVKVGDNLNSPTCDAPRNGAHTVSYMQFFASTQGSCSGSQIQFDFGFTTSATWAYWDDTSFSYSYLAPVSGSIQSSASSFVTNGNAVSYTYSFSYDFPAGMVNHQLQATLPSDESLTGISSSSCGQLTPSQFSSSSGTVKIPEGTIAACGSSYTVTTSATGSYSTSQSGSQTGDDWYDAGSSASILATSATPFFFRSWSGSPTIDAPTSAVASVRMDSYYALEASFEVSGWIGPKS